VKHAAIAHVQAPTAVQPYSIEIYKGSKKEEKTFDGQNN
jgi:hypothetical protein